MPMLAWVDEVRNGSLSAGAVGLLAARPAAASVAAGTRYLATNGSGTLYESDHVNWSTVTVPQWAEFLVSATGARYVFDGTVWVLLA